MCHVNVNVCHSYNDWAKIGHYNQFTTEVNLYESVYRLFHVSLHSSDPASDGRSEIFMKQPVNKFR